MNYRKILSIQAALRAKKDSYNQFGKYSFRSAEQIYENLKPLLIENNLLLTFQEEIVGNTMQCTAKVIDLDDNTSEKYSTQILLDEELKGMSKGQASGCSISYARKYLLCGIFLIDNGEDLDKIDNNPKPQTNKPQQKENKDEMKEAFIKNIFNAKNKSELSQLWKNNIYVDDNRVIGAFKSRKSQLGLDKK